MTVHERLKRMLDKGKITVVFSCCELYDGGVICVDLAELRHLVNVTDPSYIAERNQAPTREE